MSVRISVGPDGPKAILVGDDASPLVAGGTEDRSQETVIGTLAAAVAQAMLASGRPILDAPIGRPMKQPKPEVVWSPRRPFVPGQALRLDDAGLAILGNALLASWWNGSHLQRASAADIRQEASERTELRDLLDCEGVLDDAFMGPFRPSGDYRPERLGEVARRLEAALNSAEWFAMLSVNMLDFARVGEVPPSLLAAIAAASPGEQRTPIARLGPCPVTRELRFFVIDTFRRGQVEALGASAPSAPRGGPLTGPDRAREKAAVRVLTAIYQGAPEARLTQDDAKALLAPHFPTNRARERIWSAIEAPKWKPTGRPPKAQRWADKDLIEAKLRDALK